MTEMTCEVGEALDLDTAADEIAIAIATKSGCPYCVQAKTMLDRMGESYVEMTLDDYDDRMAFYDNHVPEGSERTMPQVFLRGQRIGGYMDLVNRVAQGPLT